MKKLCLLFISLFAIIFISRPVKAQSPSELRRMRQQHADSANNSGGKQQNNSNQSPSERRRNKSQQDQDNAVFGDDEDMFKATDVPDKWKNESAVILGMKVDYHYFSDNGDVCNLDETIRERVKVMDKAAVDDYSYFYFTTSYANPYAYYGTGRNTTGDNVGFRIIKKDGTVQKVDLSTAVTIDNSDDVPEYELLYGSSGYALNVYKKIAISNLEPGDIIDYYYKYHYSTMRGQSKAVEYPALLLKMSQHFPVVAQKVDFTVERGFYINFSSYNGAPELGLKEDINHRNKSFSFSDQNRDKEKHERFSYSYRSDPTIKFQVVYTSESEKKDVPFFLGKPLEPLTQATPDMVKDVATRIALENDDQAETDANAIIKYMRLRHPNVKDNVEYMQLAYYYFRYLKLIVPYETKWQYLNDHAKAPMGVYGMSKASLEESANEERSRYIDARITDVYFVKTMGLVCRDKKIDYDFMFTIPRNIGTLDNLLLTDEMKWVLRIKGIPETYLYPFDRYKNPNEGIGTIEGADAYVIIPNRNARVTSLDKQTLPISKYTDNTYSYNMDVSFASDMGGEATIKRTAVIQGESKHYYYPEVLVEDAYENLDILRYRFDKGDETTDNEALAKMRNKKDHDEAERKLKASMDDETQKRLDKMKHIAEDDYTIDTYDDFNLIADGREKDSTDLIFNESFKIKDVVKKVGPNYLASVGSLIGKVLNIKDTELDRQTDIYLNFPQTTSNQVVVNIPDGYTVQGVDKLNVNVTNSTGAFISTASVSGNKLTIKTQEYFTSNYYPKTSWGDMVKFLRAAYDFTQQKVLLKKA